MAVTIRRAAGPLELVLAAGLGMMAALLYARPAAAQSSAPAIATEADVTVGGSSDDARTAAVQLRAFGPLSDSWRLMLEAAWGRTSNQKSDAFGAAYAYDDTIRPTETYVERVAPSGTPLIALRLGRYRTPFGMSSRSDQAYMGFTRAPLIRYGSNFALSNLFLETGADAIVGRPNLYVETSAGLPTDTGPDHRDRTLDVVTRLQTYFANAIVGASYISTAPSLQGSFVHGRMQFGGVDGRWMRNGVEFRGEWIDGRPFDGVTTTGGYLDAIVHRLGMGPVTAVARLERIDYDAGPFSMHTRRLTAGARLRLMRTVDVQAGVVHQWDPTLHHVWTSVDLGVTQSFRF
jgi:hypothetical protein